MKKNTSAISRFQDFLETQKGQTILNYLYSWGAAIVILGALFKLTHIDGADLMLFLGMGTEVLTFIVNGFERQTSVKESEAPVSVGSPVIIGGASASASTYNNISTEVPQLDPEALTAMASIAAANAAVATAGTTAAPAIEGKMDVPEMQQVTQSYIDQLRTLTESFQHIAEQSAQLEASADEVERLSRNLTSINTIYEMHLKSLGSQIGNIDQVNDQTRRMAEQIEELNRVYDRMLQSMTVNMNVGRTTNEQSKEA